MAFVAMIAAFAWYRHSWRGLAVVGGAVLVIALATLVIPGLSALRNVPPWADQARVDAWSASIQMLVAQPLVGHGFRTFEWLHLEYGSTLDAPHNDWLRFFAEGGLIVGLAAIGFVVSTLMAMLRASGWMGALGLSVLATLVLMGSFNNPMMYVQVNVPTFLVLGIGLGAVAASLVVGLAADAKTWEPQ